MAETEFPFVSVAPPSPFVPSEDLHLWKHVTQMRFNSCNEKKMSNFLKQYFMEPEQWQTMLASTTKPELTKATLALKHKTQTLQMISFQFLYFGGILMCFSMIIFSNNVLFWISKYKEKTFLTVLFFFNVFFHCQIFVAVPTQPFQIQMFYCVLYLVPVWFSMPNFTVTVLAPK